MLFRINWQKYHTIKNLNNNKLAIIINNIEN